MRYIDVCSGISAPTMAWKPLGWQALCFAEIEAAPRAVLAHHYPDVPLRGDFTEIRGDEYGPVDILVGGTPCQDFSVAVLRAGLDGARGNLSLEFLRLLDRTRARWVVWENVPGVLSIDGGRAFGAILGGMVELGYGCAYRVLDAQHFGVPQRRRRVFVVGHLGDWRRAAAVLFERHSLQGHPAPRREAGQRVADSLTVGANQCSGRPGDFTEDVAHSLRAQSQLAHRGDVDTLVCGALAPGAHPGGFNGQDAYTGHLIAHSLRAEGFDASEDGTGRGTPLVPVCFSAKDHGADVSEIAPTLRADGHSGSHANAGVMPAVAYALGSHAGAADADVSNRSHDSGGPVGSNISEECAYSLRGGRTQSVAAASAVRRLTPRECERLQGFPDDFTLVPYRKGMMADGPRYKMLGNSMAVPVVRWIGERIQAVEALMAQREAA